MAGVNDGHRERLRERMMREGLSGFCDHEVLEMLLFQSIPRKDTNKLAHTLLAQFGNLQNVLNALPEQLMTVKGVSQVTACNIALIKEVWARCKTAETKKINLGGMASIIRYSQVIIAESYVEKLVVVYVDEGTDYLYSEQFTSDKTNSVQLDTKKIIATAVRLNASGIILFHCHVKGKCEPSVTDIQFTEKLLFALASLNVVILEHIIFNASGEYYSFYRSGDLLKATEKYNKTLQ